MKYTYLVNTSFQAHMPKLLEQEGQAQSVISVFSWTIVEYFLQKDVSLPLGLFLPPLSLVIHPEPPEVGKFSLNKPWILDFSLP